MANLLDPFKAEEIEWRVSQCGIKKGNPWAKILAYVTNRAIQNRLDEVFGTLGWQNKYCEWHKDSQLCGIGVYNDTLKEWIWKWDGAANTDIESTKGGLSDSMKRAAYQWGIGRYLYNIEETFATCSIERCNGYKYAKAKDGTVFYWTPPANALPEWALPVDAKPARKPKPPSKPNKVTELDLNKPANETITKVQQEIIRKTVESITKLDVGAFHSYLAAKKGMQVEGGVPFYETLLKEDFESVLKMLEQAKRKHESD